MRSWIRGGGFALVLGGLLLSAARAEDAPQPAEYGAADFRPSPQRPFGWRGDGSGRFSAATPPLHWSETEHLRWSAKVGAGYASPVLTAGGVLVLSEPNRLLLLDRADGKVRWTAETKPADLADEKSRAAAAEYEPPKDGSGLAAATPLTDGQSVFVVLANGIVRAFDLTGAPKWTAYIAAEQNTGYGRSASPILVGGKLIVHMTNLYAFDPATGKQLWCNTEAQSTYGTPTSTTINGVEIIVTPAGDVVRAADGKRLNNDIGKLTHASPVAAGDMIYFAENSISAIRLTPTFKDKELWNALSADDVFSSPVLVNGLLFTATGKGDLLTFKLQAKGSQDSLTEGRLLFGKPAANAAPTLFASLTLAGDYLFANSNHGDMVIFQANVGAKEVARNHLPGGIGSTPVFAGKQIFVRNGATLYCIGE
ncbi:MAG TPA: PQQ-binding-like beta-propeller repeat protein [Pirellulales bacterium]|jgi:outer membrane protein assembly factor BamB|nr:PQQ-binding-like beta-propeller repeat protein [Pirellulales bacterium]